MIYHQPVPLLVKTEERASTLTLAHALRTGQDRRAPHLVR